MKNFSDRLAEAYLSWLNSIPICCAPCLPEEKSPRSEYLSPAPADLYSGAAQGVGILSRVGSEKDIVIFRDQPGFTPPPSFAPLSRNVRAYSPQERVPRKSLGSLRGRSFSVRRRLLSNASSTRRPQISAPTDFRHLYSETFQFPPQPMQHHQLRQRPRSFRPLELSIYMPDNLLSPMLPHFDYLHPNVMPPPPAHTHGSFDSDSITLAHGRSYSSLSFHLPRRPSYEPSPSESLYESPPRIPPRSRLRAYTSPSVEQIVERIASAMIEKERLEAEIEDVIERQSIYINSRPSTAYGLEDLEPMPDIPALPAAAPSFAERLSTERPQTAPSKSAEILPQDMTSQQWTAVPSISPKQTPPPRTSSRINGRPVDIPLAPPLPLVLRPPLRKKKSFSRVSNWLFPGEDGQHQREANLCPVTNQPRPVTDRDGFYQCVTPAQVAERTSIDSVSTVSTWTTTEDRTMPTTWSPGSSPMVKQETPTETPTQLRRGTFGKNGHRRQSVGVAF